MTALEWAQRKRTRAQQAAYKNPDSEHLQRIWHYWKDIVKALHIMKISRRAGDERKRTEVGLDRYADFDAERRGK